MWGIHSTMTLPPQCSRITPTYVGNTQEHPEGKKIDWDHPHVCGEYIIQQLNPPAGKGSPPRMWGIHKNTRKGRKSTGITPTYVGNTSSSSLIRQQGKDHPHVCGEYFGSNKPQFIVLGSPPRMWGIQQVVFPAVFPVGITPTYVGNTHNAVTRLASALDHPHVCGEYDERRMITLPIGGSPPRMWGIRCGRFGRFGRHGITPTYVGNTTNLPFGIRMAWDHPHVCGEYSKRSQPLRHPYNFSFPFFMSCIASCNVAVASDSASCGWRFSIWYSANTVANL